MMLVVVSYDVCTKSESGPKRLRQVAKTCMDFGQRVQNSVFECRVDQEQWTRLKLKLLDTCDLSQDSLRFYFLGANYARRINHFGVRKDFEVEGPLLI